MAVTVVTATTHYLDRRALCLVARLRKFCCCSIKFDASSLVPAAGMPPMFDFASDRRIHSLEKFGGGAAMSTTIGSATLLGVLVMTTVLSLVPPAFAAPSAATIGG